MSRPIIRVGGAIAALALLAVAFVLAATSNEASNSAPPADGPGVTLKVMIFNIWLGGDQVSLPKVVEAIREADADIVLLQEAEGQTARLAELTGLAYASPRTHVISRFPLFDPPDRDVDYVLAEVQTGRFLAVANVHLTSDPYGPYAARDGKTAEQVLKLERDTRLPEIQPYLQLFRPQAERGLPVVVGGDFNAPSHLDWTADAVGLRAHVRYQLAWPVSSELAAAGFVDTYRAAHPDAVADPGITWTFGYPYPHLDENEAADRIDQIHVSGPVKTLDSTIAGEPGLPGVGVPVHPWPSDHLAVISTLRVVPGRPGNLVSVADVAAGEPIHVRFHAAATEDGRLSDGSIAIRAAGSSKALLTRPTNDGTDRGSLVAFGSAVLAPGEYTAALLDPKGTELAASSFSVGAPGGLPAVTAPAGAVAPGAPIEVRWSGAPGNRFDWVGLYAAGDPDQGNYLAFLYTRGRRSGAVVFDRDAIGGRLDPGRYEARLMLDDGYVALARAPFAVR